MHMVKYAINVIFGIIAFILLIVVLSLLALPLHLYRWFVLKIAARIAGPKNLKKEVNALGNGISSEFKCSSDLHNSRFSAVANFVIEGHVSYQELCETIMKNLISATKENGKLRYPELAQYLQPWMGFIFFKQDMDFRLENHIIVHDRLEEHAGVQRCEMFLDELNETLLNRSWKWGKSPWELHLVQNYCHMKTKEKCSLLVLRIHHGLGDGFALLHLIIKEVLGNKIKPNTIPKPSSNTEKFSLFGHIGHYFSLPVKMLHAMGSIFRLTLKSRTLLHCPDYRKMWKQTFCRGPLIPVKKVKFIKNHLGVSFATVLDSVVGAALGKLLNAKIRKENMPSSIAYGMTVPLPNHPKKLRNHEGLLMYEIPISREMDPLGRLRECEGNMSQVKIVPFILLLGSIIRAIAGMPIYFSKLLGTNRFLPVGMSSFPGTIGKMCWNKRKVITGDFCAIPGSGDVGILFCATSYNNNIQLHVTAEKAVASRVELQKMFRWAGEELDILYQLALKKKLEGQNSRIL